MVSAEISSIGPLGQNAPAGLHLRGDGETSNDEAAPYAKATGARITAGDIFAVTAMIIVMATVGVGLIVQFGQGPLIASGIAAAAFALLFAGHVGLRRAETSLARREPSQGKARPIPAKTAMPTAPLANVPDKIVAKSGKKSAPDEVAKAAKSGSDLDGPSPAKAISPTEATRHVDLGSVRPRPQPELDAGLHDGAGDGAETGETSADIDALIRRLADDIEAGRKTDRTKLDTVEAVPAEGQNGDVPPLPPVLNSPAVPSDRTGEQFEREGGESVVPVSDGKEGLDIDRAAALGAAPMPIAKPAAPRTMVQAARELVEPAVETPRTTTPAAKLAAIADALSDEQMDVYLETINGLEDYRAQHYEVSVRLRLADGGVLANDEFISEARGTGLLPLLEAVKVSSTKRLAVQMMQRGRSGDFFTAIDGEALADMQFGDDVDTIAGQDQGLAQRLVLAFSQADVRGLTKAQGDTLAAIAALGFKFSIEDITDLDMDFEALAARGFAFAKLDSDVFLNGLPADVTRVPPNDICRHLAKAGLALIVGQVKDETARAKILGFGAVLGQGPLFGAPRPVRASVLRPSEQQLREPAAM